ncbi:helix-turn-helix domain-containing protein [Enterococcus faecium]
MGERIKRLRLERNLTQEELGNRFGLKRAAINKYEKGNVENMKRTVIEEMSNFLESLLAILWH